MKMQTLSAVLVAMTASGAAMSATIDAGADADAAVRSPGFVQLDTNGDGTLDKSEINADPRLQSKWQELDENDDGAVSHSEFSAFESDNMEERADRLRERADERADRMENKADRIEDRD